MASFVSSLLSSLSRSKDAYLPLRDLSSSASPSSPSRPSSSSRASRSLPFSSAYSLVLHLALVLALFALASDRLSPPAPLEGLGGDGQQSAANPFAHEPGVQQMYDLSPEGLAKFGVDALYERQSQSLRQAKARYELKTNRKPPLGYDRWFERWSAAGVIIDDYEQVFEDFAPFYALQSPSHVRAVAQKDLGRARVDRKLMMDGYAVRKDGGVDLVTPEGSFAGEWRAVLLNLAPDLPVDMDVMFNYQDEPRVVFDITKPSFRSKAFSDDPEAYVQYPRPTRDWFKEDERCILPMPFPSTDLLNDEISFLLAAVSQGFTTSLRPVLSMTKIAGCFSDITVPSIYYYQSFGWGPRPATDDPDTTPWEDKIPKLYWRGGTSGGGMRADNWRHFPRIKLVTLGKDHKDVMDVDFTKEMYCDDVCDELRAEFPLGQAQPWQKGYEYRYVFDVDGNTFSGRFIGLLRSNSLVFKSTVWTEYFSNWLKPFVHYVPVAPDLSDLLEKIEWAKTHPLEARRIAAAGKEMADRVLTDPQMDAYLHLVLLHLAEVQTGWIDSHGNEVVDARLQSATD